MSFSSGSNGPPARLPGPSPSPRSGAIRPGTAGPPRPSPDQLFTDGFAGRFANRPAVAYQGPTGDVYFAMQVKPELPPAPARPRDIQILVDCSASQAGPPLDAARRVAKEILAAAGESDRVSVWTVSTPKTTRNLVRGGGLKPAAEAKAALAPLDAEYASGAIDLKGTIDRVAKEFDGKATRQQIILYLGDGESALNPLDEKARYALADSLRAQKDRLLRRPARAAEQRTQPAHPGERDRRGRPPAGGREGRRPAGGRQGPGGPVP